MLSLVKAQQVISPKGGLCFVHFGCHVCAAQWPIALSIDSCHSYFEEGKEGEATDGGEG
jgi:hypothetical protein